MAKTSTEIRQRILDAEERQQHAWDNAAEIYRERDWLVRALSKIYPSHLMPRKGCQPAHRTAWAVCIHAPSGQIAWSIPQHMLREYAHLKRTDNDWDGHKTADRFKRLEDL